MGQEEVYNLLEQKKKWLSTKQISKMLDIQQSTIALNLSKLCKIGLITKREKRYKINHIRYYEYTLSEYGNKQRKEKNAMSVSQLNMRKL